MKSWFDYGGEYKGSVCIEVKTAKVLETLTRALELRIVREMYIDVEKGGDCKETTKSSEEWFVVCSVQGYFKMIRE